MKMVALVQAENALESAITMPTLDRTIGANPANNVSIRKSSPLQPSLAHRALHRFLLDMVALVYEVDHSSLVSKTRGRKKTAFARQVAMYLAHTAGGLSLTDVGSLFGRDRTTVAHGCALIEDARDEVMFDRSLSHLESAIGCQMEMFRAVSVTHAAKIIEHAGSRV